MIICSILACWLILLWLILDSCHPLVMMTMPMSPVWSLSNALAIFAMWVVMMIAMMLPSAVPMILLHQRMIIKNKKPFENLSFILSYLFIWVLFSVGAVAIQYISQVNGVLDASSLTVSKIISIGLLVLAGGFQFTALKKTCLTKCRTPAGFFMGYWQSGVLGAFKMGTKHGLFCLGCCWAIMLLLFVGGVMNLSWVLLLTIAVMVEKTLPAGDLISKIIGVVLIMGAAFMTYDVIYGQSLPVMNNMTMDCMKSMKMD